MDEVPLPVFHSRYPGERLHALATDPIGFLRRLSREHGDAVRFRLGTSQVVLLSHPDQVHEVLVEKRANFIKDERVRHSEYLIGEGLINSEGAFHLRQRRMIQPAFHRKKLAAYADIMVRHAAALDAEWQGVTSPIDLGEAMMRLTLGIVGEALFGQDVRAEAGAVSAALSVIVERFGMALIPFSDFLVRLPLPGAGEMRIAQERLDTLLYDMIAERRRSPRAKLAERDDLLSLLLAAQDEEGDGGSMSDRQIHDEAMTLFLAGHETTANALTWALYLLARHPEVASKLRQELETVLTDSRLPTHDDLPRLVYTRQVLSEAIRLYPPIWIIARGAVEECRLQSTGHRIREGALVIFSQCVLHTDPRWWPDPFAFNPERFAPGVPGGEETRPRYAYLPFGAGPHTCIGEQFAWMEGILILATLLRHRTFHLVDDQPAEPAPLLTLRLKEPLRIRMRER
jgi:cytochrome P450